MAEEEETAVATMIETQDAAAVLPTDRAAIATAEILAPDLRPVAATILGRGRPHAGITAMKATTTAVRT